MECWITMEKKMYNGRMLVGIRRQAACEKTLSDTYSHGIDEACLNVTTDVCRGYDEEEMRSTSNQRALLIQKCRRCRNNGISWAPTGTKLASGEYFVNAYNRSRLPSVCLCNLLVLTDVECITHAAPPGWAHPNHQFPRSLFHLHS